MKNSINKPEIEIKSIPDKYVTGYCDYRDDCDGKNINVCVIGSGLPSHKDINNCIDFEIFTEKEPEDHLCLSTYVSGIFCRNNKDGLTGLAPFVNMFFTKSVKNNGQIIENAVVASVIWATIKECDIILIPFPLVNISEELEESLNKAIDQGVIIIIRDDNGSFPNTISEIDTFKNIHIKNMITTYSSDKYIVGNGLAIMSGVICGLVVKIIQNLKNNKKDIVLENIIQELKKV